MRLTLRTLLAYLDDTLDVAQAREISPKVAESDVARELIDRIKKVTRRRSLTVPEDTDPNVVAEYLDNDLSTEKLAEVEEQAIKSDVHLAEIAACHQLLTLITSEPVQVPPTSRRRMYGLVKGQEADPDRPVPRVKPATLSEMVLPDEADGNDLVSRSGGARRLYLAGGLSVAMIVAAAMAMRRNPPMPPPGPQAPVADATPKPAEEKPKMPDAPSEQPKEATKAPDKSAEMPKVVDSPKEAPKELPKEQPKEQPTEPPKAAPVAVEPNLAAERKPSDDRKEVGRFVGSGVLLQAVNDKAPWARVPTNGSVNGAARLLCLPGLSNEVRLGNTVAIELFGTLPEYQLGPFFESAVALFAPPAGLDADLRVDNGRVYLRATKSTGAKVRIRLGEDFFDVTLPDDAAELIAERVTMPDTVPFEREAAKQRAGIGVGLVGVTRGTAKVSANLRPAVEITAGPVTKFLFWNATAGPGDKLAERPELPPFWAKSPNVRGPERAMVMDLAAAARRLPQRLSEGARDINVAVAELANDRAPFSRRLSIYCQSALDDVSNILDAFDDANPEPRVAAVEALHHWVGRDQAHAGKLFDALMRQKGYTEAEATAGLKLFFGYDEDAIKDPKTYAAALEGLLSPRAMIREVAYWRLREMLDPEGARVIAYNPMAPSDQRTRVYQEWKRRIPDGQLPPSRSR